MSLDAHVRRGERLLAHAPPARRPRRPMRTRPKPAAPTCSHAEFESLPEPLQRKCFSSLERLRIAEQHARALQGLHTQPTKSRRPSRAASIALHRSLTLGSSRRRLRKAESLQHDHLVAQADAQFFLSLPEKVQRSAFTREEQVLLVGRYDPSPLLGDPPHPEHHHCAENQHFSDFNFDFYNDVDSGRGRSRRRSSSTFSVSPTRTCTRYTDHEQDIDTESSLLYLDSMSPPLSHQVSKASFRRTMSLASVPLRASTSSAPVLADAPLSARGASTWHQRAHSQSFSGRRSSHTPTTLVFDPEATHYRDPEARKKLRMYLASPQKFDEAVEFGFPSTAGNENAPPRNYQLPPITTDARNFSRDMHTFLRDDKVSFLEETEEEDKGLSDGDSLVDLDSPVTPSSSGFRGHVRNQSSAFSSLDSNGLPLINPMNGRLNREMTLRMTLTRPDLRADEDRLYGWQGQKGSRDDPYALEELQLTDDMSGTKGPFYVKPKAQGNLVSRLFKRASKKGR